VLPSHHQRNVCLRLVHPPSPPPRERTKALEKGLARVLEKDQAGRVLYRGPLHPSMSRRRRLPGADFTSAPSSRQDMPPETTRLGLAVDPTSTRQSLKFGNSQWTPTSSPKTLRLEMRLTFGVSVSAPE
jgi:hypothetical protein